MEASAIEPMRTWRLVALGGALGLALSAFDVPAALAQAPAGDAAGKQDARRQMEQRKRAVQQEVADLVREREQINAKLIEAGKAIQRGETKLNAIEAKLGLLKVQIDSVNGALAERHQQIARLMAAMQRMGRNPPPVIITRREDALEMVRSAMLLARAFPEMKQQAEELIGQLSELVRVLEAHRAESERQKAEVQKSEEEKARLATLYEAKRRIEAEKNKELAELRRSVADLGRDPSTNLNDLLPRLDKSIAEKTGLGDYEAELKAREALQAQAAVPPAAAPAAPAPPLPPAPKSTAETSPPVVPKGGTAVAMLPPPSAVELSPRTDAAAFNPGRLKPSLPFTAAKGRLPLPAIGRRALAFNEKTQYGGQSKGIVIETRHSAQVTSPADGWVIYAGPFRSYGQLLIINPGNGYHILLAGMHQIDVQLGQFVLAAEPVGTMAPAVKRTSQDNAPVLYVEFRKDGRPIDPEPWWTETVQKVQG